MTFSMNRPYLGTQHEVPPEPNHPYVRLAPRELETFNAAQDYAGIGWPVFPATPTKKSFKSAKYSNGKNWGATLDLNEIMHDWAQWPHALLGVVTGSVSRLLVIDVDTLQGHGVDGHASLRKLNDKHGPLPKTVQAVTPTGSGHYYFRIPENVIVKGSASRIAEGIDVRAEGGCIIAPPSYRADMNQCYQWVNAPGDVEIAPCPEWLLDLAKGANSGDSSRPSRPEPNKKTAKSELSISMDHADLTAYGRAAFEEELETQLASKKGSRNDTLNRCSFNLGQLVESGDVPIDLAWEALSDAAHVVGLTADEIGPTINSGLESGRQKPRGERDCDPTSSGSKDSSIPEPTGSATTAAPPEGPRPLVRETPPGEDYPVEYLGPLRDAVEEVVQVYQAPVALAASSALANASLCVQGFANVQTLDPMADAPTSLYMLTSAVSGERKSAANKPFMRAISEFEAEQARIRAAKITDWKRDQMSWKARTDGLQRRLKNCTSEVDREGIENQLRAIGPEPKSPAQTDRVVDEPTIEGLIHLFADGQPSLGIMSDEGGQFLGGNAMSSENRQKTLAALNKLWGGAPIKRTRHRENDGQMTLQGKRLAMHLMVQPSVRRGFMADGSAESIGFLPRCLMCEPETNVGNRPYRPAPDQLPGVNAFNDRAKAILETEMPVSKGTTTLTPRTLRLSDAAHKKLVDFYNTAESKLRPGGDLVDIPGYTSKIAEQAARIAGVLTLWTDLDAEEVPPDTMENALRIADYYLFEALRLAGDAMITDETKQAVKLLEWLTKTWPHDKIAQAEVTNKGPNCLRKSPKARAEALKMLQEHGWIIPLEEGEVVRGKARKRAWTIVK